MLPAIHYNGEYCRRAKEPKEEVGAGLALETKLIGLDRDCNCTEVACESFLRPTDEAVAKSLSVPCEHTARDLSSL